MSWLLTYALVGAVAFIILALYEGKPDDVVFWCSLLWPVTLSIVILALVYDKSRRKPE